MRTTLTLDDDISKLLEKQARADRVSFRQAVNNTLRAGLNMTVPKKNPPFRVKPFTLKFKPGIDLNTVNFNHLADDLADEELIKKHRASL
ncbi:MAG: hypothetical protein LBK71_12515 [Verrucomicrobiales bacterium]|jgi:hypothetical protein|nr:hypothetical protein [Verrucomicrobiales bacterium]